MPRRSPVPCCRLLAALVTLLLAGLSCAHRPTPAASPESPPMTSIRNAQLTLSFHLPDAANGYYRGPRFAWSGLLASAEVGGHRWFGPWLDQHNPTHHDHVDGTPGEFGMFSPLGYADAKVGGHFLKIGVGYLERAKNEPYKFYFDYQVAKPLPWDVKQGRGWIEFRQDLRDPAGWGYALRHRIELAGARPAFRIIYDLRNIGTKPIVTDYYCHNFVNVDGAPIGPDYELTFPFDLKFKPLTEGLAENRGRELFFPQVLTEKAFFTKLEALAGTVAENRARVRHRPSGATLEIVGDWAPSAYNVFVARGAACPEPYLALDLAPGGARTWTTTYTFSVSPPQ